VDTQSLINMQMIKGNTIAMTCSRCIREHNTLAWYYGVGLYNNSLLCRDCFKFVFNNLTEQQKLEWGFYKNKERNNDDQRNCR
jgi:late competence protein required for DNA uptake (superfamily II DNA/RNA helicase)